MKDLKNIPPHYSHTKSYRVLSKKKKKKANERRTDFSSRKMGTMTESLSFFFFLNILQLRSKGINEKKNRSIPKSPAFELKFFSRIEKVEVASLYYLQT